MRDSCINCVKKHLGQSEVLMGEALRGYPEHQWLAVGHLAEAEEEILGISLEIANEIREHRLSYMEDIFYKVPTVSLLQKLKDLSTQENIKKIDDLYANDELPLEVEKVEQFNSPKGKKL